MTEQSWVIMPILGAPDLTEAAIADCLAQSVPCRLLLINQGVDDAFRARLESIEFDVVSIGGTDYMAALFTLDIAGSGA